MYIELVPDLLDAVHAAAGAVRAHAEVLAEGGVHEERGEALHQPAPDLTGQLQVAFLRSDRDCSFYWARIYYFTSVA